MAGFKVQTPKVTALPKAPTKLKIPKTPKAPKAPATQAQGALSPLYGQKRSRPTIQSVPTRTPSF